MLTSAVGAQQPTTAQIQQALTSPSTGALLRSKIAQSGLSADQIRQRLQAAGYSPSLLDAYLGGAGADSTAVPGDDVLRASRFLGLVDSLEVAASSTVSAPATDTTRRLIVPPDTSSTRIFGLDLFRRSTSQFEPNIAGPVDDSYRVGPRDVLALILTGGVETSYSLEVTREGFVVVPQVGQVYVANLTLAQVEDVLLDRLRRVYSRIGKDPSAGTRFFVTVAKLKTNQVFVIGDVQAPGSYQVSGAATLLNALYAAGGPSDNGTLRQIELRRNGKLISTFDAYDYLIRGDASRDLRIENGDIVFVGVHGPLVGVQGEVIRPATYELKPNETLRDLIRSAGGFTATADRRRVLIRRVVPPEQRTATSFDRTVIDVSSPELVSGYGPAIPLERGDVVEVFPVADRIRRRIAVSGAVWTPSDVALAPNMRISDALRAAGGVRTDARDVLISRLKPDQSREQLRAVLTDTLGHASPDIELREDDEIRVFSASEFRPDRFVIITGAVNKGGRIPYVEGMTLRDLVHLAGGLADGAYLGRAEIARLPESRAAGTMAASISVPLDSTYLLERGLDGKYHGPPGMPAPSEAAPTVVLAPYDNVLIFRQPDWELQQTVSIGGEVQFPGSYVLLSKSDRISSLVERAGGLTRAAYLGGVVFFRQAGNAGRVGIDLAEALRRKGSSADYVLQPGDSLFIPQFFPTVRVEGSVSSPVSVPYVEGKDIGYYIAAAGGETFTADGRRAYVRQPNGSIETVRQRRFFPDGKPGPRPGSVVTVPAKDPNAKKDWTAIAGSVAQITASTIAVLAIILK